MASYFLVPAYLEIYFGTYRYISSNACTEYSAITGMHVKYSPLVGCFKKVDNHWIKAY